MRLTALMLMLVLGVRFAPVHAETATDITTLAAKAEAGDRDAQFQLGASYDAGPGVSRNADEAVYGYAQAAEQGQNDAQNSLGSILQGQKRYPEAMAWYERAAAQHHTYATNNLAYLYDMGLGVAQSRIRAFELYRQAADLGWAQAMWNIANMYGAGQLGGPPDAPNACVWTLRAAKFAQPSEQQLLQYTARVTETLRRHFSEDQWRTCNEQASAWEPPNANLRADKPAGR